MQPFPEIHAAQYARALGNSTSVPQKERKCRMDSRGDIGLDAIRGDLSWDLGVEQIRRSNLDFLAANVVLEYGHKHAIEG